MAKVLAQVREGIQRVLRPMRTEIIFDMLERDYRVHEAINISRLKRLASMIPAEMEAEEPDGKSDEILFGSLFHTFLLEPAKFGEGKSHNLRPATYPSKDGAKKWSGNANWCKDWMADHADLPHFPATGDLSVESCYRMRESLKNMPETNRILSWSARREVTMFAPDTKTGLLKKARVDHLGEDDDDQPVIVDWKSTSDVAGWERQAARFRYDMQDAWYSEIARQNGMEARFIFVVVGSYAPHSVRVGVLDEGVRRRAAEDNRMMLNLYARLKAKGSWPACRVNEDGSRAGLEVFNLRIWA